MKHRIRLAITMGDPAGVGPEVILKSLAAPAASDAAESLVIGHKTFLEKAARTLNMDVELACINDAAGPIPSFAVLEPVELPSGAILPGQVSAEAGRLAVNYILKALELAKACIVDGIVTAPINKEAVLQAGYNFPGHTELLAKETNTRRYAMMLAGGTLRVSFVTIHLPLRRVFTYITEESILNTIMVTRDALDVDFGLGSPRIGVCGLNPHASDGGRFGDEERKIITPAIEKARKKGIDCSGPLPPDTAFYFASRGAYDAVVALYHDQGSIPLKLLAFDSGVNITLGLPIVRTSVDHGTAFDIVGKNMASPNSMIEAIKLAAAIATRRQQRNRGEKTVEQGK